MKRVIMIGLFMGLFMKVSDSLAQISGSSSPAVGSTQVYSYSNGFVFSPNWRLDQIRGTIISQTQSGTTYSATIKWNTVGTDVVAFFDGQMPLAQLNINITEPPPSAPVTVTPSSSSITTTSFVATWNAVPTATSYFLDVSTTSNFSSYVTGYINKYIATTSHTVAGLAGNTVYYYRVRAVNSGGTSSNSNVSSLRTAPVAPSSVSALNIGSDSFTATWSASTGATGYEVSVSTTSNFSTILFTIPTSQTSAVITGLSGNSTYYFRVKAVNGSLQSGYSNTGTVTTLPSPPGVSFSSVTSNSFTATWTSVSGATHYQLQVSQNSNFTTLILDAVFTGANSSPVSGLAGGTTYYFRVRAYNSGWTTGYSTPMNVLTIPQAPNGGHVTTITVASFTAAWDPSIGATGYRLDVSVNSSFSSYVSGYQNILITGTSTLITGLSANTAYYFRVRAVNASGTSTNSYTVTTQTYTSPPVALAATNISAEGFQANWSAVPGAANFTLEVSLNNTFYPLLYAYDNILVSGTSKDILGSPNTTYYYRVRAVNATGPSANSNTVAVLTLPAAPVALQSTALTSNSFTANWSATPGITTYLLDVSTSSTFSTFVTGYNGLSVTGTSRVVSSLQAQKTYYYRLRAVNGTGSSAYSNAILGASLDQNFIKTTIVAKNVVANTTLMGALTIPDRIITYDYFDGLGRPMQKVEMQQSPNGRDIVQPIVNDEYGRERFKYLPYATNETNGFYKPNPTGTSTYSGSAHQQFYSNGTADKVADDPKPYSESVFIPSPVNQLLEQGSAGVTWQPDGINSYASTDRTTKIAQEQNAASEVLRWTFTFPTASLPLGLVNAGTAAAPVYYAANTLYKNKSKDENYNEVIEYKDKEGKVILKKVQAPAGQWAQTYFIHDGFGNLVCVLPPEAVARLASDFYQSGSTDATKNAFLSRWAFRYTHDAKRRMTQKQVPGAEPVYMVYDKRDRLVLTQDGNQRKLSTKYWTFTKYDEMNRPILTGIKDTSAALTQSAMQGVLNTFYSKTWTRLFETFIGSATGNVHGYTNKSYPVVTTGSSLDRDKYLNVTYYDKYDFRATWQGVYTYVNDALSQAVSSTTYSQPVTECIKVTGQVTGTKSKVLDGGVTGGTTWIKTANYYDDKMRIVQIQADNFKGGRERVSTLYDFSGNVLKNKTTHSVADVSWKDVVGSKYEGNKIFKTATDASWGTSGAASVEQLSANQSGWLEIVASETNTARMVGLSDVNTNANYTTIDYALYQATGGALYIYENGTSRGQFGTYGPGDVLKIERSGSTVRYYRNNAMLFTSGIASTSVLLVDGAFHTQGATITGVRTSFGTASKTVTERFEYDHAGRLVKTWHQIDALPEILLAYNAYNELGQLVDKKLHSTVATGTDARQSVDYRYNIRGWLSSINNAELAVNPYNDEAGDLFGMNLAYHEDLLTGNSASLQYNGNISGMKWSVNQGLGAIKAMAYNFTYDQMNRLTGATHKQATTLGTWLTGQYDEAGLQYDLNGNIKNLQRKGEGALLIDNLSYNYGVGATASNKLVYVQDNATDAVGKWKGFYDGNAGTAADYTYDANGNMVTDLNGGLSAQIVYNFLNLPEVVTKGGNSVRYIYDASGKKLAQITTFGTSVKQVDYVGDFVYENDVLQFLNHDEGRIVMTGEQLIFVDECDNASNKTASNATLAPVTVNGERYVRATSNGTVARTGIFPIGGSFIVAPGEKYRIKAKGYSTGANTVHFLIRANAVDLNWPASSLPTSANAEAWMEQTVTIPSGATSLQVGVVWNTVASGQVFYLNEFTIEKLTIATPEYQYYLKDHLGNVRVTFTSKDEALQYGATLEDNSQGTESASFRNYARVTNDLFDHTDAGTVYNKVHLLNGGNNSQVGLSKSFAVMPGDVVSAQVYAKHYGATGSSANIAGFATALLGAFGLPAPIPGEVGTASAALQNYGTFIAGGGNPGNSSWPKGFLNILVFDKKYNLIDVAYQQLEASYVQPVGSSTKAAHQLLSSTKTIKEPGYVYIYLSNEGTVQKDIYFDDLNVTHTKSKVVEANDYYPFGLTFNSYERENSLANSYKFSGKEGQDEINLKWYDFGARMYSADIGRWLVLDPLSDRYEGTSPYVFVLDDPINAVDPDGRLIIFVNGFMSDQWSKRDNRKTVEYTYRADPGIRYTVENPNYRPYPGERTFAQGAPTYLGDPFTYWGNETNTRAGIGGLFSQGYNDYNTRFISASSDNDSQASERFLEGKIAGRALIKQLNSGEISLKDGETIKVVGHSHGAAFAAGIVSVLAKHKKYSSKLEVVHYLAPHQPTDFSHQSSVEAHQWSTGSDWVSANRSPLSLFNGGSRFALINGVQHLHYRSKHKGGRGGHSAHTYLDALAKYFSQKGIKVTVIN